MYSRAAAVKYQNKGQWHWLHFKTLGGAKIPWLLRKLVAIFNTWRATNAFHLAMLCRSVPHFQMAVRTRVTTATNVIKTTDSECCGNRAIYGLFDIQMK